MAPTRSGIFKHLKFSENDKFTGTNSVDSIFRMPLAMPVSNQIFWTTDPYKHNIGLMIPMIYKSLIDFLLTLIYNKVFNVFKLTVEFHVLTMFNS